MQSNHKTNTPNPKLLSAIFLGASVAGIIALSFQPCSDTVCVAEDMVRNGKPDKAVALLSKSIDGRADVSPTLLTTRAYAYRAQGKNDLALKDLNLAEKICASDPLQYCIVFKGHSKQNDVYISRARTYYNMGKYQLAVEDADRALKSFPDPNAYFERALAYKALEKFAEAEKDLDAGLLALGAKREERFYHERASIKKHMNKPDLALGDLNQAVALKDCAEAYFDRAMILKAKNSLDECKADLNKAIQIDASLERAYHERARILLAEGKAAEALADLNAAKKADGTCELLKEDFETVKKALKSSTNR